MGVLKTYSVDLNDPKEIRRIMSVVGKYVSSTHSSYFDLRHKTPYYFDIPSGPITEADGWYIILDGTTPLYVGEASNLNNRLNSDNGSVDNFARKARTSDSERNFIKKFCEIKVVANARVVLIPASVVFPSPLPTKDRKQVEKLINIFRSSFSYK